MTDAELDAIEQRANAASAGPWEAYSASCCPDMGGVSSKGMGYAVCRAQLGSVGHPMALEDAEFCAAARSDIPALMAEVRRLRLELEAYRAQDREWLARNGARR